MLKIKINCEQPEQEPFLKTSPAVHTSKIFSDLQLVRRVFFIICENLRNLRTGLKWASMPDMFRAFSMTGILSILTLKVKKNNFRHGYTRDYHGCLDTAKHGFTLKKAVFGGADCVNLCQKKQC